jgi:hypothetical protein
VDGLEVIAHRWVRQHAVHQSGRAVLPKLLLTRFVKPDAKVKDKLSALALSRRNNGELCITCGYTLRAVSDFDGPMITIGD